MATDLTELPMVDLTVDTVTQHRAMVNQRLQEAKDQLLEDTMDLSQMVATEHHVDDMQDRTARRMDNQTVRQVMVTVVDTARQMELEMALKGPRQMVAESHNKWLHSSNSSNNNNPLTSLTNSTKVSSNNSKLPVLAPTEVERT